MRVISARKTSCVKVEISDALAFVQEHHRQGLARPGKNLKAYGLRFGDELVAVALFCNPRTKGKQREYTTELFRLAFKEDTRVVGGASKLIKHFMKTGAWDLFTYQDTSGEAGDVYLHAGMTLKSSSRPRKTIVVKDGLSSETATDNRSDWFSMDQVFTIGPDKLIGTTLGEQFKDDGKRKSNLDLFLENGYHLEEIAGDRLYEWRNPNVGFYTYKISSTANDGYYYGRHILRGELTVENAMSDGYMGSGGKKFQGWVALSGVETLEKTILGLYTNWGSVVKAEIDLIGDSNLTDPNCMNFQPGGTGVARPIVAILERECPEHGITKHQGDSCMRCASAKGFSLQECERHGSTIFHGDSCSLCVANVSISMRECSVHGTSKHNGLNCVKCAVGKAFTTRFCSVHGDTTFRGDLCEKCKQADRYETQVCAEHGSTAHRDGRCMSCMVMKSMSEKDCSIHGHVIHFGDTCATCTSQGSVSFKVCLTHGETKHQGDVCSLCNSQRSVVERECPAHGLTKFQGDHCMRCNAASQLALMVCTVHGEVTHKGGTCTFCTAAKAISLKVCAVHGETKHQGDVCNLCNSQKSVNMRECSKHGLTKHQGSTCNKCNAQRSVVERECETHGLSKFQGEKCVKCRNAALITVKECPVHGAWKHRGKSCYACISDRRKAKKNAG